MPTGQKLFGRSVRITAGTTQITGLRMSFEVKRSLSKTPNSAEVTLWNLNQEHRAALQQKGQRLLIEAGYGTELLVLFNGFTRTVSSTHQGPDWVTKIRSADGELAYRTARVVESFKAGTPVKAVIKTLCQRLGIPLQDALAKVDASTFRAGAQQFINGVTLDGEVHELLDPMLRAAGLEWSIQNGALQIVPLGSALDGDAILLTSTDKQTGLVGSPEVAEKKDAAAGAKVSKSPKHIVKVTALLNPRIEPGKKLKLESELLTGFYRVDEVSHRGDTHGQDYYSEAECRAL